MHSPAAAGGLACRQAPGAAVANRRLGVTACHCSLRHSHVVFFRLFKSA